MESIIGQGILLCYCFTAALYIPADTEFVVAFLLAVICVSAVNIGISGKWKSIVIVLFLLISCFFPKLLIFGPAMLYSILECRRYATGLFLTAMEGFFYLKEPQVLLLLIFGSVFACVFEYYSVRYKELMKSFRRMRDDSAELNLLLEEKNRSLLEKQDYEIYTATLKERNRIAREIHDHVGHMLSRAILMVGALRAVNKEAGMTSSLEQLGDTLDTAMSNVRESVHDLHDDSVNLKEVLAGLVSEYTFCKAELVYDMGYSVPREVKYSFIAIVKEALNNVSKHSRAEHVKIVVREHPGLYQLIIEDDGKARPDAALETGGIGIRNMRDRVENLGGRMQIRREKGFRIYIMAPKKEEAV